MATEKEICRSDLEESYSYEKHGDMLCNMCGESCRLPKDNSEVGNYYKSVRGPDYNSRKSPYGLNEVIFSAGYYSEKFEDMMFYQFSLCEDCLANMFNNQFCIKPLKWDMSSDYENQFYNRLIMVKNTIQNLSRKIFGNFVAYNYTKDIKRKYHILKNKCDELEKLADDMWQEENVKMVMK